MAGDPGRLVVVIMTGLDAYQEPLLHGICRVLLDEDYSVIAHVTDGADADLPGQLSCLLAHHSPCGVIATSSTRAEQDRRIRLLIDELGIPSVFIGLELPDGICIRADNAQGMSRLMTHLLDEHGARRPALLRGFAHQPDHVDRERIFRYELAQRGLPVDEGLIVDQGLTRSETFHAVRSLLNRRRDLDALVTMDDSTAACAASALAEAGLRIPDDVALTGFDNYPIAALTWPGITTVDQNLTDQGATAAVALLSSLGGAPAGTLHVACRLIVRGSTRSGDVPAWNDQLTARDVTRLSHGLLADRNAQIRISGSLIQARSLEAAAEALAAELGPLGIRRCFLVLHPPDAAGQGLPAPDGAPGTAGHRHRPARLLLDYRDGRAHPVPEGTFTSCLLPEHLQGELTGGSLAVLRIAAGTTYLGYMLLEHSFGSTPVEESLRLDIGKALKAALDTEELHRTVQELSTEIEERRRTEAQLRLSATVIDQAADGIAVIDGRSSCVLSINPAFSAITGYPPEELTGRPIGIIRPADEDGDPYQQIRDGLAERGYWEGEMWSRRRDGGSFLARLSLSAVSGSQEHPEQFVIILNDVTELRRMDEHIQRLALHDELTGLPNRALLTDRLTHRIALARRDGDPLAVMIVDLDRFKAVNDSYGHDLGNQVLLATADRLKDFLRESDTIARVGGDEFVAILADGSGPEDYAGVAQRAIAHLSQPMTLDGRPLRVGASAGIACYPEDGETAAELVKHAEAAMHSAKAEGSGRYRFFRREMTLQAQHQLQLEMELREAVELGGLELFYQPKIALVDGSLRGAEALVRWRHPTRGLLPPVEFIPLAEERGLICDLGGWVLEEACRQSRTWQRAHGGTTLKVGVNISALQVRQTDVAKAVLAACERHDVNPSLLEIELTESSVMENLQEVSRAFAQLRAVGATVAVDDFGTGYSSFAYLRDLPVDVLKVDRSFLVNLETRAEDRTILRTIITLGRDLRLDTVAEGVETRYQADLLLEYRCPTAQGYLFDRPLPAAEFERKYLTA